MKPSPTPWTLQKIADNWHGYPNWSTYAVRSAGNICLAVVGEVDRASEDHNEANGTLMTAAPELRTMLERLLDGVLRLPELPPTVSLLDIEQCQNAIAKSYV